MTEEEQDKLAEAIGVALGGFVRELKAEIEGLRSEIKQFISGTFKKINNTGAATSSAWAVRSIIAKPIRQRGREPTIRCGASPSRALVMVAMARTMHRRHPTKEPRGPVDERSSGNPNEPRATADGAEGENRGRP